jgi:hypothetical protein
MRSAWPVSVLRIGSLQHLKQGTGNQSNIGVARNGLGRVSLGRALRPEGRDV